MALSYTNVWYISNPYYLYFITNMNEMKNYLSESLFIIVYNILMIIELFKFLNIKFLVA